MALELSSSVTERRELLAFVPAITYAYLFVSEDHLPFLFAATAMVVPAAALVVLGAYSLPAVSRSLARWIGVAIASVLTTGFVLAPIFLFLSFSLRRDAIAVEEVAFTVLFLGNVAIIVGVLVDLVLNTVVPEM